VDDVGHGYVLDDRTGRHSPEDWSRIVVDMCADDGYAGVVGERNHIGDALTSTLRAAAKARGLHVEVLQDPRTAPRPFPPRRQRTIYVREVVSHDSKMVRATPTARLAQQGLLHHVQELPALERQMTEWEPGRGRSPNRLDALAQAANEVCGLSHSDTADRAEREVSDAATMQNALKSLLPRRARLGL
jgi:phage terminase large subunit-like protein